MTKQAYWAAACLHVTGSFLSTDLCIFPYLFLRKQTSPSRSCRWSLPLISRKSHTFPLTPLKYPAVNLTPFPKCSSHNESRTPASSNPAQSARLQKAQTMARLSSAEIPGSSQVQVLWGFLCLVLSSAHLRTFVFTVISPSSCKLIDPTTVNLGGSQKSNPWVYTIKRQQIHSLIFRSCVTSASSMLLW